MATPSALDPLQERKRLLVLQADLHRQLLSAELDSLRGQADAAREGIRASSPWVWGGCLVAGLAAARHWRTLAQWAPTLWGAWQWVRRILDRRP